MASNQVVTYEEVKAYRAQYGVALYAENSGGYTTGGIYVEWTTEGGFTGGGWKTSDPSSPVYDMTDEQIKQIITNDTNLNSVFGAWVKKVDYVERYTWILNQVNDNCRYEVTL